MPKEGVAKVRYIRSGLINMKKKLIDMVLF